MMNLNAQALAPESSLRSLLIAGLLVSLLVLCLGCHTANGFGKDMEKAGEKIQDGTK
jgi:predicted small secreted protein